MGQTHKKYKINMGFSNICNVAHVKANKISKFLLKTNN